MPIPRSKTAAFTLAMLLFCTTVAPHALAQAAVKAGGFRIAGKMVSSISGAPLSQARVTIASVQDQGETESLITGGDGAFDFKNVASGKYSLSAARRGFSESSYNQHGRYSTAIVTGGDVDPEHLVFRLTPQAMLTGRVLDEAGDAVRKASVSLYRQDQSTGISLVGRVASTRTDDRGTYEFAELPIGNYFLFVSARPWYALHPRSYRNGGGTMTSTNSDGTVTTVREEETITTPVAAHSFDVTYATTYYADTTDSDEATPIPLRGGERLTVDVRLSPVPALRILVRMDQQHGRGWAMPQFLKKSFDTTENITMQMMAKDDNAQENPRSNNFTMLGNGKWEFTGIPAGKYTVRVPASPGSGLSGSVAEFDISENGQELNPSAGEPVSNAKFAVQIVGEARPPQHLTLALQNGDHKIVRTAPVDAKGDVEFVAIPPGKYTVLAAVPAKDYAVTRINTNQGDNVGRSLDVAAGSTIEGRISLVGGNGIVQGFAKSAGKGIPGAMIVLAPRNPDADSELLRRDQSDLDGSFSLVNVLPGAYTIVAIENGWDLNWSQPGVISHYMVKGQNVVVAPTVQEPVRLSEPVEVQPRWP